MLRIIARRREWRPGDQREDYYDDQRNSNGYAASVPAARGAWILDVLEDNGSWCYLARGVREKDGRRGRHPDFRSTCLKRGVAITETRNAGL